MERRHLCYIVSGNREWCYHVQGIVRREKERCKHKGLFEFRYASSLNEALSLVELDVMLFLQDVHSVSVIAGEDLSPQDHEMLFAALELRFSEKIVFEGAVTHDTSSLLMLPDDGVRQTLWVLSPEACTGWMEEVVRRAVDA